MGASVIPPTVTHFLGTPLGCLDPILHPPITCCVRDPASTRQRLFYRTPLGPSAHTCLLMMRKLRPRGQTCHTPTPDTEPQRHLSQLTLLPLQVMEEMLALLRRSCSCVPSTSPSLVLSPKPPSPQAGEGGRSSSPRVLLRVQGELAPTWMCGCGCTEELGSWWRGRQGREEEGGAEKSGSCPSFKAGIQGLLEASSWVWGPWKHGEGGVCPSCSSGTPEAPCNMTGQGGSVGGSRDNGTGGVLVLCALCGC